LNSTTLCNFPVTSGVFLSSHGGDQYRGRIPLDLIECCRYSGSAQPLERSSSNRKVQLDLSMPGDQGQEGGHAGDSPEPSGMAQNDRTCLRIDRDVGTSARRHNSSSAILAEESARLQELQASVRDQDDLERDIGRQVRWLVCCLLFKNCLLTRPTTLRRTNFLRGRQTKETKGDWSAQETRSSMFAASTLPHHLESGC
jgi:hypothetical protein